jgi:hypothetical protein
MSLQLFFMTLRASTSSILTDGTRERERNMEVMSAPKIAVMD